MTKYAIIIEKGEGNYSAYCPDGSDYKLGIVKEASYGVLQNEAEN